MAHEPTPTPDAYDLVGADCEPTEPVDPTPVGIEAGMARHCDICDPETGELVGVVYLCKIVDEATLAESFGLKFAPAGGTGADVVDYDPAIHGDCGGCVEVGCGTVVTESICILDPAIVSAPTDNGDGTVTATVGGLPVTFTLAAPSTWPDGACPVTTEVHRRIDCEGADEIIGVVGQGGVLLPLESVVVVPCTDYSPLPECVGASIQSFTADDIPALNPFTSLAVFGPECCAVTVTVDAGTFVVPKGVCAYSPPSWDCEQTVLTVDTNGCDLADIHITTHHQGSCI